MLKKMPTTPLSSGGKKKGSSREEVEQHVMPKLKGSLQ